MKYFMKLTRNQGFLSSYPAHHPVSGKNKRPYVARCSESLLDDDSNIMLLFIRKGIKLSAVLMTMADVQTISNKS
jgi:hypothetical protein